MSLRPVRLPDSVSGSLWLSAMPGRFGSYATFQGEAQRTQLAMVVCLTPPSEVQQLSPIYHAAIAQGHAHWRWLNLPMPNFGVPENAAAFREGVARIAQALQDGEAVMMH